MDPLTIREIAEAAGGTLLRGDPEHVVTDVTTDSRTAGPESLFIPLIGKKQDAHRFVPSAEAGGCRAFLLSEKEAAPAQGSIVLVSDTKKALACLAAYYLDRISPKKAAVTGSVGKTTTRDMLFSVLSQRYRTGRPLKNYNNEIGVPLTIFSFDRDTEAAVLEEGMEHAGTIHEVTSIVRPDVAVITNVGISHLENLGSRENILKAKMEITDFFGEGNVLVINSSNDLLRTIDRSVPYRIVTCGTEGGEDYTVKDVEERGAEGIVFTLVHGQRENRIALSVSGAHNALNAALAAAAGEAMGVSPEDAVRGLESFQLTGRRLSIREGNGLVVIDDSYNAAPDSMRSALDTLISLSGGARRVALLGDMNELGPDSPAFHSAVGRYAAEQNVDLIVGIGGKAKNIANGARDAGAAAAWFEDAEAFLRDGIGLIRPGDRILVKGSNAMRLGRIADRLTGTDTCRAPA